MSGHGQPPNQMMPHGRGMPMGYMMPSIPPMGYGMYPTMAYPTPMPVGQPMYPIPPQNVGNRLIDWVEYKTPEGKKYWGNNITKKTTWDEPDPVKKQREAKEAEQALPEEAGWIELRDAKNKSYYKHKASQATQTSMPKEVREYRKKKEAEKIAAITPRNVEAESSPVQTSKPTRTPTPTPTSVPKKQSVVKEAPKPERIYESRSERKEVFKQMLKDLSVSTTSRYEEIVRLILTDDRYEALKSKSDRVAAFSEYCKETDKQLKDQQAEELKAQITSFKQMLDEAKTDRKFSAPMSYDQVRKMFEKDERFTNMSQDSTRRKVTQEYMSDLSLEQKTKQREELHRRVLDFGTLLRKEKIKPKDKWSKVSTLLDTRDKRYCELSEKERQFAFSEYISHLTNIEEETRYRERTRSQAKLRQLRKDLLCKMKSDIEKGLLHPLMSFDSYRKTLDKSLYKGLVPELVEDLFIMLTTELQGEYPQHKKIIKAAILSKEMDIFQPSGDTPSVDAPAWAVSAYRSVCQARQSERRSTIKSITSRLADGLFFTLGSSVTWPQDALSYFKSDPFWFDLLEFDPNPDTWVESIQNSYNRVKSSSKQKERSERDRSRGRKRRKE